MPIERHEVPDGLIPVPRDRRNRMVLARGEATGHAHVIAGDGVQLMCPPDAPEVMFLLIEGYGRLGHEEHGPIPVTAGTYRVVRQREYTPGAVRPVSD